MPGLRRFAYLRSDADAPGGRCFLMVFAIQNGRWYLAVYQPSKAASACEISIVGASSVSAQLTKMALTTSAKRAKVSLRVSLSLSQPSSARAIASPLVRAASSSAAAATASVTGRIKFNRR